MSEILGQKGLERASCLMISMISFEVHRLRMQWVLEGFTDLHVLSTDLGALASLCSVAQQCFCFHNSIPNPMKTSEAPIDWLRSRAKSSLQELCRFWGGVEALAVPARALPMKPPPRPETESLKSSYKSTGDPLGRPPPKLCHNLRLNAPKP